MSVQCFLMEDTGRNIVEEVFDDAGKKTGSATRSVYKRSDTGEEIFLHEAPVGAIFRATWLEDWKEYCGTDGKSYICRTPGGDWNIDSRASNCGLPNDEVHKCWCRHGEAPNFTVDKSCNTCVAGAGSIQIGDYHGFLTNGVLS
jgi:hypothetical protein